MIHATLNQNCAPEQGWTDLGASPDGFSPEPRASVSNSDSDFDIPGNVSPSPSPSPSVAPAPTATRQSPAVAAKTRQSQTQTQPAPQAQPTPPPVQGLNSFRVSISERVHKASGQCVTAPTPEPRNPMMARLVKTPSVKAALAEARKVEATHQNFYDSKKVAMSPNLRADNIERELRGCRDHAKAKELVVEMATLRLPEARHVARAARHEVFKSYEGYESCVEKLLEAALVEADKLAAEITASEQAFFASWSIPHKPTTATAQINAVRENLKQHRARLVRNLDAGTAAHAQARLFVPSKLAVLDDFQ